MAVLTVDLDQAEAEKLFEESLTIWRRLGDRRGLISALTAMLYLHRMRMDFRAAEQIRPWEQIEQEHGLSAARNDLSEADLAAAWSEGRAMTLEQSIAYALDETGP